MKKILVTYADKHPALLQSQNDLVNQSRQYFNGYATFNRENLDLDFYTKNKHILDQPRGSGFWLWKPFIINKVLSLLDEGDIVMYLDAGTSIVGDMNPLFEVCMEHPTGILLFENRDGNPLKQIWINKQWTKRDCFIKMNCDEEKYHNGPQCSAGIQMYRKNKTTVNFVKEYLDLSQDEDTISDKPSYLGPNFPEFVDHRHDQCIVSLLAIKHDVKLLPNPAETGEGCRPADCKYKTIVWHHRGTIYGRK